MKFKITQLEQAIQKRQILNYDKSVLEHQLTRLELSRFNKCRKISA
ncbi:MAG: hypothetical protein ACTSVO_06505 [Candidatus Heimdallarchaeaceae archaeon]